MVAGAPDPTRVPWIDRLVEFFVDACDAMTVPVEMWLRRRAIEREMLAMRGRVTYMGDCSAWAVLHMHSGEEFTGHFAANVLGVREVSAAHAWLLANGYEECGADVWKKKRATVIVREL